MLHARLIGEDDYNSNARILGEDVSAVEEYLKDSEAKLYNLDHEISPLYSKLAELVCQEREISARVTALKTYIAPIRRIMPEILQEIFVHCIPTAHNAIMSSKEAPLLLGRVCSYWRQVALSTPSLWSTLHICIPSLPPNGPHLQMTTVIKEWLHRSQTLPLSISISSCRQVLDIQDIVDTVAQFSSRWRRIYVQDIFYIWENLFLKVEVKDVPLLEELVLVGYGGYDKPELDNVAAGFIKDNKSIISAPLLHRISLWPLGPNMKKYPIHWAILTALDLIGSYYPYNEIRNILKQCPNLEIFTLTIESASLFPEEETETTTCSQDKIFLPHLRTLHLIPEYNNHTGHTIHFFQSLYAPQLRHLKIEKLSDVFRRVIDVENHPLDSALLSTLCSFFVTLEHGLEELCLKSLDLLPENIVITLLQHLPLLRRLSLCLSDTWIPPPLSNVRLWHFVDSVLDMFIAKPNNGWRENDKERGSTDDGLPQCLCPHLEVLHCIDANFKSSSLLSFLRSRTSPVHSSSSGSRLRKASISFIKGTEAPSEGVRKEIEMLEIETGLSLDLWYYPPGQASRIRSFDLDGWRPLPEKPFSAYDGLGIEDKWSTNSGEWTRFPVPPEHKPYAMRWV